MHPHNTTRMTGFYWRLPLIAQRAQLRHSTESKSCRQNISHLSSNNEYKAPGASGSCHTENDIRRELITCKLQRKFCFIIVPVSFSLSPSYSGLKGSFPKTMMAKMEGGPFSYRRTTFLDKELNASANLSSYKRGILGFLSYLIFLFVSLNSPSEWAVFCVCLCVCYSAY